MALFKRFYKTVVVGEGLEILLDGKVVKTPMRDDLILPNATLAGLIAKEWKAQKGAVKPDTMPQTRLANTALDTTTNNRDGVIKELMAFAGHDLLCYRAEVPLALREAEEKAWDPYLDWLQETYQVNLVTTNGIATIAQDKAALGTLRQSIDGLDVFPLTALHNVTTLSGSLVLGLALMAGFRSSGEIWAAGHVDEDFQIAEWGEDEEAQAARKGKAQMWQAVADFFQALN